MKKILSTLFLVSFLAVLLAPVTASAGRNPDWPNCSNSCDTVAARCNCGIWPVSADDPMYCWNGEVFGRGTSDQNACVAYKNTGAGGTTGATGQQQAKAIVSSPAELIAKIESIGNWIFTALLVVAGIFLIISGFFFVTSSGNPETINKARQMLINALIGVAIAVGAKGMVLVIKGILGG